MPREIAPGRSCLECRRRKIKCDRSHPCAYCVKVRINCKYPIRPTLHDEHSLTRVASLETKLLAVEKRLAEIGDPLQSTSPAATELSRSRGQKPQDAEAPDGMKNPVIETSHFPTTDFPSLLSKPRASVDVDSLRPSVAMIAALWQNYLETLDPLLKIFHTPTVQKLVISAVHGREKLELASECLLFAIYYGSVASMSPADCRLQFEEERHVLLKRYRTAVEHLLPRLKLLESVDMTVLQAFAIYLITGRCDEDGPDVYALVGLAVGMALKMGLNRDGAALGLPPFEVEMRRRLWWQLFILDIRVAEDRRSEPCILESSFNTRLPSNIPDTNLHPKMTQPPVSAPGRTEMLFSLVRFEGSYFARQMVFSDSFGEQNAYITLTTSQKAHTIDIFQERIEQQYLSYLDDNIPFDKITAESARLVLAKIKLMIIESKHAHNGPSDEQVTRRRGWIKILEDAERLREYVDGKKWLWLFQTYIEWDALAQLLLSLRAEPFGVEADRAWNMAFRIYDYWKHAEGTRRDQRWKQIEELRLETIRE
ncbi:fungal-specific transcription factor domain-containing protein [Aspergillus cavernicola]|uniref:Fungal-specific transcription factor domain-containing protein n=1 Tax=Aspergillus cavernicola TaxID=176166 RepID=A0ABR4HIG6_9EURO